MATHNNKQVQFWCILAFACLLAMNADVVGGQREKGDFVLWQQWTGVRWGDALWGDFDGDGDLDLVYGGQTEADNQLTQTYENQDGALVFRQELIGLHSGGNHHIAWGDYDGDGDLDLAITGGIIGGDRIARIYQNDGSGNLTLDNQQALTGLSSSSVAWGDYDNDGDLDLVIIGLDAQLRAVSILYRNEPTGTLEPDSSVTLLGLFNGLAEWADHDNDGDLDLLLMGRLDVDTYACRTVFYENDPVGTLTDTGNHGLPDLYYTPDAAWGDYDNDGDLDLALLGIAGGGGVARVYRNDGGGNFTQVTQPLNLAGGGCAWGDYDNDGDLDLIFTGSTQYPYHDHTKIYENTGSDFSLAFSLVGLCLSSSSWADVDQDGDLDLMITGNSHDGPYYARLYRNLGFPKNTPPLPPTELDEEWTDEGLRLSWSGASDAETPTDGLYYCLRVGTSPGAHDIMSGTYGSPLMGNVGQMTEIVLDVPAGQYDWSVLAIDSGFMTSCAPCVGDIWEDGEVDTVDLLILLSDWGNCPDPPEDCPSDLDGNGTVNTADLLLLLANWGPCE